MSVHGNILGSLRAEADQEMLAMAFIETSDSSALTNTTDFNIVVGRRGTGKSALFAHVNKFFMKAPRTWVHKEIPLEHSALETQNILKQASCDYRIGRAITRLLWRAYILTTVGQLIKSSYKLRASGLEAYFRAHSSFSRNKTCYDFMNVVLKSCSSDVAITLPSKIATLLNIEDLEALVRESLTTIQGKSVLLFDSLDEGWQPTEIPTALLGGLAIAASDLNDAGISIHVIAFVRDNMFRALAHFDQDFSRHIEGSTLRLRWELNSLFHLVAKRIRIGLRLTGESDVKAWNRFAKRGIEGREGFERCLQSTLYRPRDILGLLNRAYLRSKREGREQIINEDIEAVARMISTERLDDLLKEYTVVLPGLRLFADLFRAKSATWTYSALVSFLDKALQEEKYEEPIARDFAIFGSGREIFFALYSVGFFGVSSGASPSYAFCHDGALSEIADLEKEVSIAIHPCYWRALDISENTPPITLLTQIYDDDQDQHINPNVRDQRMKRLGQVVEELPKLDLGKDSACAFEEWVQRAVQILFTGHLSNVALHPSPGGVQRRDVVATVTAESGFWKRVCNDYGARQVVFEVKNYTDLKPDDYRQALSYGGDEYGRITFMVYRTQNEGANDNERSHLLEAYRSKHLVFLLPAKILARCLSKQRSRDATIYWRDVLSKRLDTHVRSYLSIKSAPRSSKKKQKRKI